MNKLAAIQTDLDKYKEEVVAVLDDAKSYGFKEIFIIGVTENDRVHLKASSGKSTMDKIGALEVAKLELFNNWD